MITSEEHFCIAESGDPYVRGPAKYSFWSRYLDVFDEVVVLGRARLGRPLEAVHQRADGPGVFFRALPDYTGPWEYLRARRKVQIITRLTIAECDAYLLRMPGVVSQMVWREIVPSKKPYAVEAVGDPWDALSPGSWPSVFRSVFRRVAARQMKRICAGATAVSYVTAVALQRRYPSGKSAFSTGFSDAMIEESSVPDKIIENRYLRLREMPWNNSQNGSPFRIGFIGSFSRLYKGPDVLLRAAALCKRLDFQLVMVGQGRYLAKMKTLAVNLGIADRVRFLGQLPSGSSIYDFLDGIDLFVLPSLAEGLPRALLEAMSRACPCVGSAVGGIPELLDASDLVPPGIAALLAERIAQVAGDSNRLIAMSERNVAKAAQFDPATLNQARHVFLEAVKNHSAR